MKALIMTDLEGISGVDSIDHIFDEKLNVYACERLMADTNAAVEGAILGGADTVYVVDGHGGGNNFIDEMLDPRATKISVPEFSRVMREEDIDAYLQVGAHAMPGTLNGFLDHTMSSKSWYNYKINGVCYGEIVIGALFAGYQGTPCVMVSGDEAGCAEAKACLGDQVACAVVKKGIGRNKAECIDSDKALLRIRNAAEEGVYRAKEMPLFTLPLPMTVRLELMRSDFCDELVAICKSEIVRVDARTLERTVSEIKEYNDILFV